MSEPESLHLTEITAVEELDPSLSDGFSVIYDREVPIEVRNQVGDQVPAQGTVESIKVKMLLQGTEQEPQCVRVELSSEIDLFFHYVHTIDETDYQKVQEQQKLMAGFQGYATILIRMLNTCIREPQTHIAIFLMQGDNTNARLDFIQNMQYKFVELMSCLLKRSSDEIVQHHITYRYNAMKQKLGLLQSKVHEITNLVKTKNPSLLLQLQKFSSANSMVGGNTNDISPNNYSTNLLASGVIGTTSLRGGSSSISVSSVNNSTVFANNNAWR